MTKSIVIYPYLKTHHDDEKPLQRTPDCRLKEAVTLCKAIDLTVNDALVIPLRKIEPATILTSGKLEELAEAVKFHEAKLLIVDAPVTPGQQRNLEKYLNIKVLDRIGLILEIFGQRAATREGNLQVELARLTYQKSRIVKAWSHLERQRGGGGFTGGPGETQKESDRRMIDDAIKQLEKRLAEVARTRHLHRKSRQKVPYPVIALAGYTNAGKSTLFNRMTKSDVFEADMLFATLDPTLRTISLSGKDKIILSDTVGFISDLPTQLVKAFRATLEEVTQANILLHVRDISHPETDIQKQDVVTVLKELGLSETTPIIEIFNKKDLLLAQEGGKDHLTRMMSENELKGIPTISCSALTGEGIEEIKSWIQNYLGQDKEIYHITVAENDNDKLNAIYQLGNVLNSYLNDENLLTFEVEMDKKNYGALCKNYIL